MKPSAVWRTLRDVVHYTRLAQGRADPVDAELMGLTALERLAALVTPAYVVGEGAKAWHRDKEFLAAYNRLVGPNRRSAERKQMIRSLARAVIDVPGDSVEAGVYLGATSWFICDSLAETGKFHHAFDSFEGLPVPTTADGEFWHSGDLAASEESVRQLLAPYPAAVHRGWIPEVFDNVELGPLCFVHIDVDLYEPTRASLEQFYPLLSPGGMLVCDDYGFVTCPGARRAVDEYMADRPERVIHLPTGQGLVIRQSATGR